MQVTSYSEARSNLKAMIDRVVGDRDALLIHRRSGGNAVLVSEDAFNAMQETLYLLSSPANAQALGRSIEQFKQGQATRQPKTKTALR